MSEPGSRVGGDDVLAILESSFRISDPLEARIGLPPPATYPLYSEGYTC
jgi:hypothetical protein